MVLDVGDGLADLLPAGLPGGRLADDAMKVRERGENGIDIIGSELGLPLSDPGLALRPRGFGVAAVDGADGGPEVLGEVVPVEARRCQREELLLELPQSGLSVREEQRLLDPVARFFASQSSVVNSARGPLKVPNTRRLIGPSTLPSSNRRSVYTAPMLAIRAFLDLSPVFFRSRPCCLTIRRMRLRSRSETSPLRFFCFLRRLRCSSGLMCGAPLWSVSITRISPSSSGAGNVSMKPEAMSPSRSTIPCIDRVEGAYTPNSSMTSWAS